MKQLILISVLMIGSSIATAEEVPTPQQACEMGYVNSQCQERNSLDEAEELPTQKRVITNAGIVDNYRNYKLDAPYLNDGSPDVGSDMEKRKTSSGLEM